jgi:hypothetical protein
MMGWRDEPVRPDEPMDTVDAAILTRLMNLYANNDRVPPGLVERTIFAVALDDIDVEVCRLTSRLAAIASRGPDDGATTVTFESTELTIMLRVADRGDDSIRVDGWLVPAGERDVELRTGTSLLTARADAHGRFSFEPVPHGLAHVVVRSLDSAVASSGRTVATPPIML